MSKPQARVFLSSTYRDLVEHRKHVIAELRKASFNVICMEDWTATPDDPTTISTDRIDGCDVFVLLVAMRRGHIPDGHDRSITQMEYDHAMQAGIPVFAFLLDEKSNTHRDFDDFRTDEGLRDWREHLSENHTPAPFTEDPASIPVTSALFAWYWQNGHTGGQIVQSSLQWTALISDHLGLSADDPDAEVIAGELLPIAIATSTEAYRYKFRDRQTTRSRTVSVDPDRGSAGPQRTPDRMSILPSLGASSDADGPGVGTATVGGDANTKTLDDYARTCLTIIPFGERRIGQQVVNFDRVYEGILLPAITDARTLEGERLMPVRYSPESFSGTVSEDLFELLKFARLAVVDISDSNGNVMYEVGSRHAISESGTVLFRRKDAMIPFDLGTINIFEYDDSTPQSLDASRVQLTEILINTLSRNRLDSPIRQALPYAQFKDQRSSQA